MSHLEEGRQSLLRAGESASKQAKQIWGGFTDFILQDNVLEVAVGLILASAFTAIVSSLTSDIILPFISLLPFLNRNLDEKFAVLHGGPHYRMGGYNTVQQAQDDGAVVMAYGAFLDKVIRFFIIGLALYTIAQTYGYVSKDSIIKHTVKCRYCRKRISEKARRCVNCTSWQDGREE